MKKIGLHEIRREFLNFFKEKDHLIASSYSLVPHNDKSLLLIGAGMAPLKAYFTGDETPPHKRMATCQKCIRTGDIENVGKTDRHATFFEMLGNFSFGDYFKKEAIEWAWEFLNINLEIPAEDLWISIYLEDDEAFNIWNKEIGVPEERIVRLGKEDNFWELEIGPSGPCSEIYIDRGEEYGCGSNDCKPGCECDRFIEVWNLVFTQFNKDEKGNYHPLPNPNIDTGMGLERIAAVLQGADNIFEVQEIKDILNKIENLSHIKYGEDKEKDVSVRVIADHSRAMTFLVSDGVLPSNEGRGYILRRLIRRAARHGKLLGIENAFLSDIVDTVIESWKVEYKELDERRDHIKRIIKSEEDKFQETIHQGINILEEYIKNMISKGEKTLEGDKAFKLYDTYGFPLDLTKEILIEKSLTVDEEGFNQLMEAQRNRARKAREEGDNSGWGSGQDLKVFKGLETKFKGYETTSLFTNIIGILVEDEKVDEIKAEEEGIILLSETPFYGESGGQIGDTGIIEGPGFKAEVLDTKISKEGLIIHMVKVIEGMGKLGQDVKAIIEENRRNHIKRNHSATHLLHKALKEVLGDHVNQAGSIVMPNRLRFDFTHFEAVKDKDLKEIERIVNENIFKSLEVITLEKSIEEANELGAIGLFEDKYEDEVRIVKMGDYSMELCGGTHVTNTNNIGIFKIVSESGIAAGVRRIEGIVGEAVYNYINEMEEEVLELTQVLKTNKANLVEKAKSLVEDYRDKEREIETLKGKMASNIAEDILDKSVDVMGIKLITYKVDNMDMNSLRNLGDEIRNRMGSGVLVLSSLFDNKISFVAMVTKDLLDKGLHAGNIIREVSKITGGGGGGRPDMAQAGGKDVNKVEEALSTVIKLIEKQLNK